MHKVTRFSTVYAMVLHMYSMHSSVSPLDTVALGAGGGGGGGGTVDGETTVPFDGWDTVGLATGAGASLASMGKTEVAVVE